MKSENDKNFMRDTEKSGTESLKEKQLRNRLEINSTLVLSIATLSITWCSYQSNLWSGIQSFKIAEANQFARLGQQKAVLMAQHQTVDATMAMNFVNAYIEHKEDRVQFYLQRGRPEMASLYKSWMATNPFHNKNAPAHPLAMPEYNQILSKTFSSSDTALKKAEVLWKEAENANKNADNYVLLTVIFSLVLFLGAIATKMTHIRLTFTLIVICGIICFAILLVLFFLMPVTSGD